MDVLGVLEIIIFVEMATIDWRVGLGASDTAHGGCCGSATCSMALSEL